LSDSSPNPLTRALLRSGRSDAPSDDARRHAAIAIGVAGVITASTGTAGAASGATGAATASKWIASAALLKWSGVAIVGATLAGGVLATEVAGERSRETPPPEGSRAVAAVVAHSTPPLVRPSAPSASAVSTEAAESAQSAAAASAPAPVPARNPSETAATPIDDGPSLRGELDVVDRARMALSDRRPERALAELDAYRRAFPHGSLTNEATVLRIEALARSGQEEAAAREARTFLARDPGSPHARRVRALLASMGSEDGAR
jgi:hypothetical protein